MLPKRSRRSWRAALAGLPFVLTPLLSGCLGGGAVSHEVGSEVGPAARQAERDAAKNVAPAAGAGGVIGYCAGSDSHCSSVP